RRLPQIAQPHQFPSDGLPVRAAVFPSNAISGKLLVPPAPDFVRVGTCQHFDNMTQTEAKAAFLPDAIDAGEKFLRGDRAVEGVARLEAIIAAAAVGRLESLSEIAQQFD